jgi:hypothetical protein
MKETHRLVGPVVYWHRCFHVIFSDLDEFYSKVLDKGIFREVIQEIWSNTRFKNTHVLMKQSPVWNCKLFFYFCACLRDRPDVFLRRAVIVQWQRQNKGKIEHQKNLFSTARADRL